MLGKRKLGKTDIEVSPIGIGVMQWFGGKGLIWGRMPKIETEVKNTIIQEAFDGGVNFFDTAEIYGFGRSESALSTALQANDIEDKDVVIGTKWRPLFRRARNMRKSISARTKFLHPYTIDLYMVHFPWFTFSTVKGQMNEMGTLIQKSQIRSVGVSNFKEDRMRKAQAILEQHDIPLASNQVQYNLLSREIETNGVLDAAKELDVTIIAYTPLGQGLLTGKYHSNPDLLKNKFFFFRRRTKRHFDKTRPLIETLTEIGKSHNATPGQVALNWLITSNDKTIVAIPGATKLGHAQESAGAMTFTLSKAELEEIAEESEKF